MTRERKIGTDTGRPCKKCGGSVIRWANGGTNCMGECRRARDRKTYLTYLSRRRIKLRKQHYDNKARVYAAYGNKCSCCGEERVQFLTIDHVNNDGAAHRKVLGKGTRRLLFWIIKNNFPSDFRLLCWNCNCARGMFGYCPHEIERKQGVAI